MKKVLLATTMLVAGASIAAAEVTVTGDARMGIVSSGVDDLLTLNTDEGAATFTSRARVIFTLSQETDSGLSFGATFRADNAGNAANGLAGNVSVSGAFGTLTMGDVDGAAQAATGHVDSMSLTGLGDVAESTFIGAGGLNLANPQILTPQGVLPLPVNPANPTDTQDPTLRYEYTAGAFTGYLSLTNPADSLVNIAPAGVAALNVLASNASAIAVGGKYTFGDYYIGLGYEKVSGFIAPNAAAAVLPGVAPVDNTNLKHTVLTVGGTVAGVTFKGLYGKASGTYAGANVVTAAASGKQYAASASYTMNAITGTVFYTDDSGMPGAAGSNTVAYGIGASYDLGAGASVRGGIAKTKVNGPNDTTVFDIGLNLAF